jgi:hypothetical protein
MSSHEQPQAKVNGVHRARVATGRPLSEKATEPFKPATPATPLGPTTAPSQDAPPAAGPAAPRRAVRVVQSSADAGTKHRPWVYVKHALMHPWHVVVLAGATVFGVANWSLLVLLLVFGAAELFLLAIVLRLHVFRRYVDERLDQVERAKAAEQRTTLFLQMGEEHRRELLRLESVVDKIRDATRPHGTAAQLAGDECLRLLASYVRLAIAYNVSRECLASVDRRTLDEEIRTLEAARFSPNQHTRALAQRRSVIARKRAERWDRSRASLEAIAHQLAMIGELVQLTHEQVAAPIDPSGTTDEIDRVVEELDESQSTIEELAEFLGVDETIEPRMLELGRAARC